MANTYVTDIFVRFKGDTSGLKVSTKDASRAVKKIKKDYNSFGKVMRMNHKAWKKFNMDNKKFTSGGAKLANRVRMITHGLRGFRMALLGIMFAGQNLNKSMMALLKPAMQARNITEQWGESMKSLFLPIIEAIEPLIKSIGKFLSDLPAPVKMAIGGFVVFAAVIGKIMFLIGSFGLAIGSLIMLLPNLNINMGLTAKVTGKAAKKTAELVVANVGAVAGEIVQGTTLATLTGVTAAYTVAVVAAKIATEALQASMTGGLSVLDDVAVMLPKAVKYTNNFAKAMKGSGLHAAVVATTPQIKKFTSAIMFMDFILKGSKKDVSKEEKAFKGSGLWSALKYTNVEMKDTISNVKYMDFSLIHSEKRVTLFGLTWQTVADTLSGIWEYLKGSWAAFTEGFKDIAVSISVKGKEIWDGIIAAGSKVLDITWNFAVGKGKEIFNIFKTDFEGLAKIFNVTVKWLTGKGGFWDIIDAIKEGLSKSFKVRVEFLTDLIPDWLKKILGIGEDSSISPQMNSSIWDGKTTTQTPGLLPPPILDAITGDSSGQASSPGGVAGSQSVSIGTQYNYFINGTSTGSPGAVTELALESENGSRGVPE